MNIAGSLNYDTAVDTKGLEQGLDKAKDKSKDTGNVLAIALGNIVADLAGIAANGLSKIVEIGVSYNREIEKYQTALTTLTGSADEANQIIEQIKKDAAETPFDVNGLVQANQLLISAGVSSENAREDILALGNAISATGGGNEELSRMVVNLQQIKNVGQASSLDIKQFAYAGIDVYGLLADSMGVTREEASELDVTYEQLTEALRYAAQDGGKYANAMVNQSKTLNGQISNLQDNFSSFAGEATEPLFNLLKDEVLPIINEIISGTGDIDELIPQLTDKIVGFVIGAVQKLIQMLPQVLQIGIDILLSIVNGISQSLPQLVPVIVQVITQLITTLIDNLPLIIETGITLLLSLIEGIMNALPDIIAMGPTIIESLVTALTDPNMLIPLVTTGIRLLYELAVGLINAIPDLVGQIPKIIKAILNGLKENIQNTDWKALGKNILDGILNGITNFGNSIKTAAKKLFNEVKNQVKSFFGISSPSKKMRDEVGKFIPQGIAVGIEMDTDSALDAIDEMNEEMMDKLQNAVSLETGSMNFTGTNGSVTQMLSAFGTTTVVNENKLYLDGDQIYENQQEVSAKKNLQSQFGGGYSVSS